MNYEILKSQCNPMIIEPWFNAPVLQIGEFEVIEFHIPGFIYPQEIRVGMQDERWVSGQDMLNRSYNPSIKWHSHDTKANAVLYVIYNNLEQIERIKTHKSELPTAWDMTMINILEKQLKSKLIEFSQPQLFV